MSSTIRAGLATAVVCAAVIACDAGAPAPRAGEATGGRSDARPPNADPPAGAPAPRRRGDRHARAAARAGARPLHEVTGTVVRAGGGRVAIRPRGGSDVTVTLRIGPRTTVTAQGGGAPAKALAPGDEVRASWRAGDDPPTALSVEVRGGGGPPGEGPFNDRG